MTCRSSTNSDVLADTAISTAPWRAVASGTACRRPPIAAAQPELPVPEFPAGRQCLAAGQPGEPESYRRAAAAARRAPRHAARSGFPSRPWTATELINWVSRWSIRTARAARACH
jgi:hypothetical protein